MKRNTRKYGGLTILFFLLLGGCATTTSFHSQESAESTSPSPGKNRCIILMPMDIELSTLTAGGMLKPEAEWTANAIQHVETALQEKFKQNEVSLLTDDDLSDVHLSSEEEDKRIQLIKLHEVVGGAILTHQYVTELKLPTKKNVFDWSLGEDTLFLKEKYGADCALFVYLRDSYASGGRVAFMIAGALLGVAVPMGQQIGFASLVDLNTGDIVWFNRLTNAAGDLRTESVAKISVDKLLNNFPL